MRFRQELTGRESYEEYCEEDFGKVGVAVIPNIAEESSKSIAAKIRQEVATSLLGQANQAPQIALSLLRGA